LGEAAGLLSGGFGPGRRRKLKNSSFLVYNQQFLTLIKAGLPILNSLDFADQASERRESEADPGERAGAVKGGELLVGCVFVDARRGSEDLYPTLMAGEKSGNIDEVLTRYINFQRLAMTSGRSCSYRYLSHASGHWVTAW